MRLKIIADFQRELKPDEQEDLQYTLLENFDADDVVITEIDEDEE